jgi:hypothetical protein
VRADLGEGTSTMSQPLPDTSGPSAKGKQTPKKVPRSGSRATGGTRYWYWVPAPSREEEDSD